MGSIINEILSLIPGVDEDDFLAEYTIYKGKKLNFTTPASNNTLLKNADLPPAEYGYEDPALPTIE